METKIFLPKLCVLSSHETMAGCNEEAVVSYFSSLLDAENQPLHVLLSTLTILRELLDKDVTNELKISAVTFGLQDRLVALLNIPCGCSELHFGDSVDVGICYQQEQPINMVNHSKEIVSSEVIKKNAILNDNSYASNVLLYTLTMKCLQTLCCSLPMVHFPKFVSKSLIETTVNHLSPYPVTDETVSHNFYQFEPKFTVALKDILGTARGKTKVAVSDVELKNQRHLREFSFYETETYRDIDITFLCKISLCSLQVLSPGKMLDVAEELISHKVAWKSSTRVTAKDYQEDSMQKQESKSRKEKSPSKEEVWMDVHITNVLKGNFFWMIQGDDLIAKADEIRTYLRERQANLIPINPKNFDTMVLVCIKSDTGSEIVRGRVTAVVDGIFIIFGLDSGLIYRVPPFTVFQLPCDDALIHSPPLVSLGRLKGILPKPLNPAGVELAATTLALLCRLNMYATNLVLETNFLSILPDLIACPDLEVANQCLRFATNLLLRKKMKCCDKWQSVMLAALETLNKCVKRSLLLKKRNVSVPNAGEEGNIQEEENSISPNSQISDSTYSDEIRGVSKTRNRTLINSCLMFLVNRLYLSRKAKEFLYQLRGVETIIRTYLLHYKNTHIRERSLQVLCNFVHVLPSQPKHVSPKKSQKKSAGPSLDVGGNKSFHPTFPSYVTSPSSSPSSCNAFKKSRKVKYVKSAVKVDEPPTTFGIGYEDSDEEPAGEDDEDFDNETFLNNLKILNCGTESVFEVANTGQRDPYIRAQTVPFCADKTHAFYQTANLEVGSFANIVCGMLNSAPKGTIYLGIEASGVVHGVKLINDQKDQIRLGIGDILLSQILPAVIHFHVNFIPVFEENTSSSEEDLKPCLNLFVIEVTCAPSPGALYCCKGDKCFYRTGARTISLSAQDMWEIIFVEQNSMVKGTIKSLEEELQELRMIEAQMKS